MVSLLWAVIIYTQCLRPRIWYYRYWEYNIYVCENTYKSSEYTLDYIIGHELGHLFLTMYLKKNIDNKEYQEEFANNFAKVYVSNSWELYNLIKTFLSLNI